MAPESVSSAAVAPRRDLAGMVLPLSKALTALESAVAIRHGLTIWQYAILVAAAKLPGLTQRELAVTIGYDRNRIIADLDSLERRELLTRRVDAVDRRSNRIEATQAGRQLAQTAQRDLHAAEDELLAAVPADDRVALHRALLALHGRVTDDAWRHGWLQR